MKKNDDLLDSLLELQSLDNLPRVGFSLRGVGAPESISEHLFHTSLLVWIVGRGNAEVDLSRALELALLHDLAEVRLGDLPRTAAGYFPPGVKAAAEREILADLLEPLPGGPEPGVAALREYQQGSSREARLVATCDKLQLVIKAWAYCRSGQRGLGEFFAGIENFDDGGFPVARQLVKELVRRLAAAPPGTAS